MINSSGIKVKDAAKIDAMMKAMKISSNTTVTFEAQKEAQRILEYEIDFCMLYLNHMVETRE